MFDLAQRAAGVLEDYMMMSDDATEIAKAPPVLATAIELRRVHGARFAAAFLFDSGVAIEVALELLQCSVHPNASVSSKKSRPSPAIERLLEG